MPFLNLYTEVKIAKIYIRPKKYLSDVLRFEVFQSCPRGKWLFFGQEESKQYFFLLTNGM